MKRGRWRGAWAPLLIFFRLLDMSLLALHFGCFLLRFEVFKLRRCLLPDAAPPAAQKRCPRRRCPLPLCHRQPGCHAGASLRSLLRTRSRGSGLLLGCSSRLSSPFHRPSSQGRCDGKNLTREREGDRRTADKQREERWGCDLCWLGSIYPTWMWGRTKTRLRDGVGKDFFLFRWFHRLGPRVRLDHPCFPKKKKSSNFFLFISSLNMLPARPLPSTTYVPNYTHPELDFELDFGKV